MFTREPLTVELKIFKWIFLPLVGGLLIWLLIGFSSNQSKCESLCLEGGYFSFKYIPSGRVTFEEQCYCQTEKESKIENGSSLGTKIPFQ